MFRILGTLDKERMSMTDDFFRQVNSLDQESKERVDEFFKQIRETVDEV